MRAPLLLVGLFCACVDVRGGAVELAWKLYRRDGIACCPDENPCQKSRTAQVRVRMTPLGTSGAPVERVFPCEETQAATRFDVPPGRYSIVVDGVCPAAQSALGPGPIERDVRAGEVVQLGAIALTVDSIDPCCAPAGMAGCT